MFISSTLDKPGEKNQTETNDHHSAQKSAIEVQILAVIVCNLLNTPWMDFHIAGYIIPNISWINHILWVQCTLKSPLDWFSIDLICLEFLYSPAGLLCRVQCCEYLKCGFPEFMAIGLRWKIIKDSIVLINLIVYLDEASTSCNTHIYTNNWKQNLIHLLRKRLQSKLHEVSYRGCNDMRF